VTDDLVDEAFWHELVGRAAAVGQQCRYLLDTALHGAAAEATGFATPSRRFCAASPAEAL